MPVRINKFNDIRVNVCPDICSLCTMDFKVAVFFFEFNDAERISYNRSLLQAKEEKHENEDGKNLWILPATRR